MATYIMRENIKYFRIWEVRIVVEKLNINEAHIFPRQLLKLADWKRLLCV